MQAILFVAFAIINLPIFFMKRLVFLLNIIALCTFVSAQDAEISFVGRNLKADSYIQISRVEITNLTRNWTEALTYPDTVLTLTISTGIKDNDNKSTWGLEQNTPNPFHYNTSVHLSLNEKGAVNFELTDISGKKILSQTFSSLQPGTHQFNIRVATLGVYLLTASQNGQKSSVKMIQQGEGASTQITYAGLGNSSTENAIKKLSDKPFRFGDLMKYKAFTNLNGIEEESCEVQTIQMESDTIVLPFDLDNEIFVCGTSAIADIDGNIYHSVELGQQCWLGENLKTTRTNDGKDIAIGTAGSLTKAYRYCFDDEYTKETFGTLYNFKAVSSGKLCPNGWHVPTRKEFEDMITYMRYDSPYLCNEEDTNTFAKALASTSGWKVIERKCAVGWQQETNNTSGMSIYPAGCFVSDFGFKGIAAYLWTSTSSSTNGADYCRMEWGFEYIQMSGARKESGYAIRCIKDY